MPWFRTFWLWRSRWVMFSRDSADILQAGFDVLNALTLLDNNMFLSDQKVSLLA